MDFSLFFLTLKNVLVMMLYLACGYAIRKAKLAKEEHLPMISILLMYVCTPFMIINAFLNMTFSWEFLGNMGLFFVITLALQCAMVGLLFLIFRKKADAKLKVAFCASAMGNVGFFGMPILRAVFPGNPEMICYSTMYMMSMNTLAFTVTVFALTGNRKYIALKNIFLNPTSISFYAALPLFMIQADRFIPDAFLGAFSTIGGMSAPLCMIILGVRLASAPLKDIFKEPGAYLATAFKLVIYPLFAYGVVSLLPLPFTFKAAVLVLSATPCAAIILTLAELHHTGRNTAARALLMSTILCVVTIPCLMLLL